MKGFGKDDVRNVSRTVFTKQLTNSCTKGFVGGVAKSVAICGTRVVAKGVAKYVSKGFAKYMTKRFTKGIAIDVAKGVAI